jgi:hypothetical protein
MVHVNYPAVLLLLGGFAVACHRTAPVQRNAGVGRVDKDSAGVVAFFKDTGVVNVFNADGRTFALRAPGQRQSLRATLRKERELWHARAPQNYRFLLQVGCFCPGVRGWQLIEVRSGQPLRAWDRTGKPVALADWNTFSIDGLFDNLERAADADGEVQVAFDQRWHFPTYVRISALRGPDMWSIIEARALRPI